MKLRKAVPEDIPQLSALIDASVRGLQAQDYSPQQIELALKHVYGVDSQLIADGTYFVVDCGGPEAEGVEQAGRADSEHRIIIGCGGWSRRKTLCGGDVYAHREDQTLLDPACDAAKIRAFFVHPDWARRGIGSMVLRACEQAAVSEGFTRLEMGATLTGAALYTAHGYAATGQIAVPLPDGRTLPVIRMEKTMGCRQTPAPEGRTLEKAAE